MAMIQLHISGMSCASCVSHIETELHAKPGVERVWVSLLQNMGYVQFDAKRIQPDHIIRALSQLGYPCQLLSEDNAWQPSRESTWTIHDWVRCGVLALVVMGLAMIPVTIPYNAIIQLVLATVILLLYGRVFMVRAWRALRHRHLTMNTLIALSTLTTYGYSCFLVSKGHTAHLYFETMSFIVAVVMFGQWLEARSRQDLVNLTTALIRLRPLTVTKITADEGDVVQPLGMVLLNDCLRVKPGERIPVDGVLVEGTTEVDESIASGEMKPIAKQMGDSVLSGSLNLSHSIQLRVTTEPNDSFLSRFIGELIRAQSTKAPVERLVDRVSGRFVFWVILIALVTLVLWLMLPHQPSLSFAIERMVSVLMLACPSALGLATPTAISVAMGVASQRGILVKQARTLEVAKSIDTVVFDKTGTLTQAHPHIVSVELSPHVAHWGETELLSVVASLEQTATHPLAHVILERAKADNIPIYDVSQARSLPGEGVGGRIDDGKGLTAWVGKPSLLETVGVDPDPDLMQSVEKALARGYSVSIVIVNMQWIGLIAFEDAINPEAQSTIQALVSAGMQVKMLTGDSQAAAQRLGQGLGLTPPQIIGDKSPEAKVQFIATLQAEGKTVAMVGDGLNDAPALAKADVGIAVGSQVEATQATADVVLLDAELSKLLDLGRLSERTMVVIRQNLFFSFLYNAVGIPLAAGVYQPWIGLSLDPHIAGAAMALSSVLVVSNSLRHKYL